MAWIEQIPIQKASGLLKRLFDDAMERTGRVSNIMQVMSVNPEALRESDGFYRTVMYGESPLSRVQRELLAVVVSKELECQYCLQAHAHELREEVAAEIEDPEAADGFVHAVVRDWSTAPLAPADRALGLFAAKLSKRQEAMKRGDLDDLRAHGFDDRAIHDAVQVIGYFNYITRIAEGLGVEAEDSFPSWGEG